MSGENVENRKKTGTSFFLILVCIHAENEWMNENQDEFMAVFFFVKSVFVSIILKPQLSLYATWTEWNNRKLLIITHVIIIVVNKCFLIWNIFPNEVGEWVKYNCFQLSWKVCLTGSRGWNIFRKCEFDRAHTTAQGG